MKSLRRDSEVERALAAYRMAAPRMPVSGRSGELLGRGTGSSLEFQEYREYMPGDDIRHVDWAAYARSDALMVRLFRDEISPRTDVLLDVSRSMATGGDAKMRVAKQLATVFALLAARLGGRPNVILLDDSRPCRTLDLDSLDHLADLPFSAAASLADLLHEQAVPMKRQAVRIVISDFLFPHDPDALVRRLAREASSVWVIQLLNAWEAAPDAGEGRRLIDAETADEVDLMLDRRTIARYRERLASLQEEIRRSCRRLHARFVTLIADKGLTALCRQELCIAELLAPGS